MSLTYQLTCKNNSSISGTFCIFQTLKENDPSMSSQPKSLAWLTKKVHSKISTFFSWTDDIFFVWGEYFSNNVVKISAQLKTNPNNTNRNSVRFTYEENAYLFRLEKHPVPQGKLLITADNTVKPTKEGEGTVVGLGCAAKKSSTGTIVYNGNPNINYLFTPKFNYYVTFGDFKKGQIIPIDNMTAPYKKIPFTSQKTSFIAVMRPDNRLVVRFDEEQED